MMLNTLTEHLELLTTTHTPRSASGRGSGNKLELTGIKKLRELILELAVRGKLVPQNPEDEPASVLLERIAAEKGELIAEGKIKRQKPLPAISDAERPFDLPRGWEWVRFGNICDIDRGGSPRPIKSFLTNDPDGLNWIKIGDTDIGGKYITSAKEKIRKEGLSKTRQVYPGDFLLTNSMSFGRPYITRIEGCIHDGWLRISPPEALDKDYLYSLLSSAFIVNSFRQAASGAVVMNLNADKVKAVCIAVPPVAEQHRIVAKVDELMALCDQMEQEETDRIAAHQTLVDAMLTTLTDSKDACELAENWSLVAEHFDTLFTTEASITRLRQTILQLAVMGRLVPQNPDDEPAAKLLERIAAEKAQLVKDGKIKKQKPSLSMTQEEKFFVLPVGWEYCRLSELIPQFQNGASSRGDQEGQSIVVLRLADIKNWQISLEDTRSITISKESITRYSVEQGDVLIIRVNGSADIVGRFITCNQDYNAIYCDHFIRMRFPINCFDSRYLSILGSSRLIRDKIADLFVSTAGQKTVNQTHIGSLPIALPPLAEQYRIVTRVNELMALCDTLQQQVQQAQSTQQLLASALVEQAIITHNQPAETNKVA